MATPADQQRQHAMELVLDGWREAESVPYQFTARREYKREIRRVAQFVKKHRQERIHAAKNSAVMAEMGALIAKVDAGISEAEATLENLHSLPCMQIAGSDPLPRILQAADEIVRAFGPKVGHAVCIFYFQMLKQHADFTFKEIRVFPAALKLALLAEAGRMVKDGTMNGESRVFDHLRCACEFSSRLWEACISQVVPFEAMLEEDPSGIYPRMDVFSKNMYRSVVADFARKSGRLETEVARQAFELAARANSGPNTNHVGYYLLAQGRSELLENLRPGSTRTFLYKLRAVAGSERFYVYAQLCMAITLSAIAVLVSFPGAHWILKCGAFFAFGVISLEAIEEAATTLIYQFLQPRGLPRLSLGVEEDSELSTAVIVPALLISEKQIDRLVSSLEEQFLFSAGSHVRLVLLMDSPDSVAKPGPGAHNPLVRRCARLIEDLNRKYDSAPFAMLYRKSEFNPQQGVWMGRERKRGKIEDFFHFIKNQKDPFDIKTGDMAAIGKVRYAIVIDEDCMFDAGGIQKLIGTMAHPLNRAVLDEKKGTVSRGYGIISPRPSYAAGGKSNWRFSSIFFGEDTTTQPQPVRDNYQDLFGKSTCMGKGIYDLDIYGKALAQRLPENTVLSHDIIDGAYMRTGFAGDVRLFEQFPSSYEVFAQRRHRWVRGDWQNLPWILPKVPCGNGKRSPNRLGFLYRWALLQNIRRSTIEIACLSLFLCAWFGQVQKPGTLIASILLAIISPAYLNLLLNVAIAMYRGWFSPIPRLALRFAGTAHLMLIIKVVFTAHLAFMSLDAISRTVFRMLTRKNLLEWQSMVQIEEKSRSITLSELYFAITLVSVIAAGTFLTIMRPSAVAWLAVPFLLLWGLSKPVSRWLATPV
jgi:hypothetical protein